MVTVSCTIHGVQPTRINLFIHIKQDSRIHCCTAAIIENVVQKHCNQFRKQSDSYTEELTPSYISIKTK